MTMEATVAQTLQFSIWTDSGKVVRQPSGSSFFSQRLKDQNKLQVLVAAHLPTSRAFNRQRHAALEASCSYNKFTASIVESGNFHTPLDDSLVLKKQAQAVEPYLSGRCIYLVGMMGSGKTTVGKVLAQAINYTFIDSDSLVEHDVGGTSVAEIFKHHGEGFFRDKETEALCKLSSMHRLVVSTGGGAVVRPVNWKCMKKGISVWLDVPLDALARRISAVGTGSRPLLHHGSGDAYGKTFMRLTSLFKERGDSYANANAKVSLEKVAAKLGYRDVSNLTPASIVIEVLEQIKRFLKEEDGHLHMF